MAKKSATATKAAPGPKAAAKQKVKAIPDGFSSVSAYLVVKNAREALDFYTKAFGAEQALCMTAPGGGVMHAEIRIGNSTVMLSEENPKWPAKSAQTLGGSPVGLHVYCEDCDAAFARAIEAGCTLEKPLMDMFWGDRFGGVKDPFGFSWTFATHKEDVSPEEMGRRAEAAFKAMAQAQPPSGCC